MPGILRKLLDVGILAVLVISPTQYAIEVREKTYLSAVDPIVWGVFLLLSVCLAMRLVRFRRPSLFGCLLVLMVGLSAIRASSLLVALKELFQVVEYFIVAYMLFAYFVSDVKRRALAVYAFAGVGTMIVVLAFVQYLRPGLSVLAVSGTFGNRNVLGGYLAMLLPLMTGLMLYEKNRLRFAWYALTVAVGLIVSLSGGAVIGVLLSLAVVSMCRSRVAFAAVAVVLLLAAFLVVPHLPRDNGAVIRESIQLFDDDSSVTRRYTEWQAASVMAEANPLLGVGAGHYQENIGMYYGTLPDPVGPTEPDIQNLYLVTASSVGVIGLVALLGLFCQAAVFAGRRYSSGEAGFDAGLALGLLGAIIAVAIAGIWSPLLVRGLSIPLVFLLALANHGLTLKKSGES